MFSITAKLLPHFKGFGFSPEIMLLFVYMQCRFSLNYWDLGEMMRIRGAQVDHSTLQRWLIRFVPLIEQRVRERKKPVDNSWRVDQTYVKLNGKWVYLYRALDSSGNSVDFLLREHRGKSAALAFFRKAFREHNFPEKVVTDKSGSNRAALDELNSVIPQDCKIKVFQKKYLNNIVEQDHRFIKKRTRLMLGFKSFYSAVITITGMARIRMI